MSSLRSYGGKRFQAKWPFIFGELEEIDYLLRIILDDAISLLKKLI